jgi:hypothetical protein
MLRQVARRIILLVMAGLIGVSRAYAQAYPSDEPPTESAPVLPYGLLLLFTILTLVIVCMPSRRT